MTRNNQQQRTWCGLKTACTSLALCCALFPSYLYATTLTNVAELAANSSLVTLDDPNDTYQLNVGTHNIPASSALIQINNSPVSNIQLTTGTDFTLGQSGGTQTDHLLMVNKMDMLDGTLTTHGGLTAAGDSNNGLFVTNHFYQTAGTINAYGGSGEYALGIGGPNGSFIQQGTGILNAYGGSGSNAYGLGMTSGSATLTQNGGGSINALGGTGANSYGLRVSTLNQSNGTITATGGVGNQANGIRVNVLNQEGGASLTATGGSGSESHGIQVMGAFIQDGAASLTATGGSASSVFGMTAGSLEQKGSGTLTFTGGTGANSHGFSTLGDFSQNGTGLITASGGTGTNAMGIHVAGILTQNNGSIIANGTTSQGISAATFIQNGGIITATATSAIAFSMTNGTQTSGSITAKGGSVREVYGMQATNFLQNAPGGIMALTGGSAANTFGFSVGKLTQQAGTIRTTGGSGNSAHGLRLLTSYTQGGGLLKATGGSYIGASGVYSVGSFLQQAGTIEANGGSAHSAFGIHLVENITQAGSGLIQATGGRGTNAYGLAIRNFIQTAVGRLVVNAGAGAIGVRIAENLQQQGAGVIQAQATVATGIDIGKELQQSGSGSITATGGTGASAYGINIGEQLVQSGTGTITATGGSGQNSYGVRVAQNLTQSSAGTITATAGTGTNAHGINVVKNLTQTGTGSITATGSTTGAGNGLNVSLDITQSSGIMSFIGGNAANANGAFAGQDFNQSGTGSVVAQAGAGADAYGFRVGRFFNQTGGSFATTASDALNGYGTYVHESATLGGTLNLTPNMGGAVNNPALYVHNNNAAANGINFGAGSMLRLDLDGNTQRSGMVQIQQGNTDIAAGASVDLGFIHNMHSFAPNQTISMMFLENIDSAAVISNSFQFLNSHPALNWNIAQIGNDYYLRITRLGSTIGAIDVDLPSNATNLINAFPALAGVNTPESAALRLYADIFENSRTAEEARRNARFLQHNLTPHTFTRVPRLAVQHSALIRSSMHNHLNSLQQSMPGTSQVSTYAEPSSLVSSINHRDAAFYKEQHALGWQVWMDNYGQFGSIKTRTSEYLDAKQHTMGMAIGTRRVFESGHSLAIAGHYLNNTLDTENGFGGGKTDIRTQSTGASIGLRMLLPEFDLGQYAFAPRLEVMTTYSALDIDQERYVFANRLDSSTYGNLYQGHAMLYTPFMVSEKTVLTPEFGMTYSVVDIGAFNEENQNNLGLHTDTQNYNSLLVHLGVSAETAIGSASSLYGGITISKDILEDQVKLNNRFRSVPQVAFQTVGEKDTGISAHMRTGMHIGLWDTLSVNPEYTFGVSQGNQTHSFGLTLGIDF